MKRAEKLGSPGGEFGVKVCFRWEELQYVYMQIEII